MKWWGIFAAAAMLAGCTSSSAGGGTSSSPPSLTPLPTLSTPATTSSAPEPVSLDMSGNWRLIKQHMKKDFHAMCLLSFACTAHDRILGADITTSYVRPGPDSITVKYVEPHAVDVTGAELALQSFARYFSTRTGTQFDFDRAVENTLNALPVGHSRTTKFPPAEIVIQHPTAKSWQFTVQAVGA